MAGMRILSSLKSRSTRQSRRLHLVVLNPHPVPLKVHQVLVHRSRHLVVLRHLVHQVLVNQAALVHSVRQAQVLVQALLSLFYQSPVVAHPMDHSLVRLVSHYLIVLVNQVQVAAPHIVFRPHAAVLVQNHLAPVHHLSLATYGMTTTING